jgi:hypothetical protein
MKRIFVFLSTILMFGAASLAYGQTAALPVYDCIQNGTQAVTSGLKSSNYLQGVVPYCTVTIYLTGTTTIATTNPQTPLQAKSDGSIPPIYATTGVGYDVKFSGGIYPNVYVTPVTLTDVQVGGSGGGGGGLSAPVLINQGGTGATTVAGAQANLGILGPTFNVMNSTYAGGAKGDGVTDDTAAIKATYAACFNSGTTPWGGTVQFPGGHSYLVSSTIPMYDGCKTVGGPSGLDGGFTTAEIIWNGSTTGWGTTLTITNVNVLPNCTTTAGTCIYSPSFPQNSGIAQNRLAPNYATITATNSLTAGQWVELNGLSSVIGSQLNRCIGEVASATSSSFVMSVPCVLNVYGVTYGSVADSGTATTESVVMAFDANAQYEAQMSNLMIVPNNWTPSTPNTAHPYNVGIYYGSPLDTGSNVYHVEIEGSDEYGFYISQGGINQTFGDGWCVDGMRVAGIYMRDGGGDNLDLGKGTVDNDVCVGCATPYSGGVLMLDETFGGWNQAVKVGGVKFESNTSLWPNGSGPLPGGAPVPQGGIGAITILDMPSEPSSYQVNLDLDNFWNSPGNTTTVGFNFPSVVVSPPNDRAVRISMENASLLSGNGSNTTVPFVGIPSLVRDNMLGSGAVTHGSYAYSGVSTGITHAFGDVSPTQFTGDVSVSQLYQHKVFSSPLLETDTAFTALPNGTTLFAGQIIAPSWLSTGQYAIYPVSTTGTTGTLNSGATTGTTPVFTITGVNVNPTNQCNWTGTWNITAPYPNRASITEVSVTDSLFSLSAATLVANVGATSTAFSTSCTHSTMSQTADSGTAIFSSCLQTNSATNLSAGQQVSIGTTGSKDSYIQVQMVDATVPTKTIVLFTSLMGWTHTNQTLSFAPPVLGPVAYIPALSFGWPSGAYWNWPGTMNFTSGSTATFSGNVGFNTLPFFQAGLQSRTITPATSGANYAASGISFLSTGYSSVDSASDQTGCSFVPTITNTVNTPYTTVRYTCSSTGSLAATFGLDLSQANVGVTLPSSVPATQVNGNIWTTSAGLYAYINGAVQGPYVTSSGGVADTTFTTGTTAVAANSCNPTAGGGGTSVTMTGLTSSMTVSVTPASDTSNVTGWGAPASTVLYLIVRPGSGSFNYYVCNNSSSSVTPGASVTWNASAR